jgi:hypothetical protein
VFCVDGLNCKVSESEEKQPLIHNYVVKSETIKALKAPPMAIKERYGQIDIDACFPESD